MMSRRERINRITSYSLFFLFLLIVQEITLSNHPVFGMILNPIPAILCALFLIESPILSICFGFIIGLLLDVSNGTGFYFYGILLTVTAYFAGSFIASRLRPNASSALIFSLFGPIAIEFMHFEIRRISSDITYSSLFLHILPNCFISYLISIPALFILLLLNNGFRKRYPQ